MAALIPRSFIDEVLHRTDIVILIEEHLALKKQGRSYLACCPFHQEKTPSFHVIEKKQFYHCFGCGASGNAISFVMQYLQQGFVQALALLAARVGLTMPEERVFAERKQPKLTELLANITSFYQENLTSSDRARAYLQQRGIHQDMIDRFQLGYAPSAWHSLEARFKGTSQALLATGMLIEKPDGKYYDRYRHRIMFPIMNKQGLIIAFGARAIEEDQTPKYLNSPETAIFQKNRELYGLYQAIHSKNFASQFIVVEGYLDVISLAQHGIEYAVATLGTATNAYHIELMHKYASTLFFCFDGDDAGRKAAWRALEHGLPKLSTGIDIRFVLLPKGQDPDSFLKEKGKEAFLDELAKALPLQHYFINTLSEDIDMSTIAGKMRLLDKAKPYLLSLPAGPYQALLLEEFARVTKIESHRLLQHFATQEKPPPAPKSIHRSPIRLALALLLQNPSLYFTKEIPKEPLEGKDKETLQTLLTNIASNPTATTASLLEFWRDTVLFEPLLTLAAWNHQVPEEHEGEELVDILHFLHKQQKEAKIQTLLRISKERGLNKEERVLLQTLLQKKHLKNV